MTNFKVKSNRGITLIALVVTIIVLIILAGININLVLGENGIITKAKEAVQKNKEEEILEKLKMNLADLQIKIQQEESRDATLEDLDKYGIKEYNMLISGAEDIREVKIDEYTYIVDNKFNIIQKIESEPVELGYSTENLLVYLDGEDAPVNNIWKDRSGNNNDALMTGSYIYDSENKAYNFSKEEGQAKITKFDYEEGITISACIELLEYEPIQMILIGNGYLGDSNVRPTLGVNSEYLYSFAGINQANRTVYQIEEDRIYTITLAINKQGIGNMYVNGQLVDSNIDLEASFPMTPTNDFRIRGYGTTSNTDYYDNGLFPVNIYNILVYDGALLEEEISHIYNIDKERYKKKTEDVNINYNTEDLLVYLDGADAPVDNIWKDKSGNSNDAVMSGTYIHDVENKLYTFTEEKGQGKITKFNYTNGITISSRVKIEGTSTSNGRLFIGNGYAGNCASRPALGFKTDLIQMIGGTNSGNTTSYTTYMNRYYTISMTIDKNGNGKTYINGNLIATANLGTSFPATPLNDFRIRGYGTTSNADNYDSSLIPVSIRNVLVYDKELTEEEIKYIYKVDKIKK